MGTPKYIPVDKLQDGHLYAVLTPAGYYAAIYDAQSGKFLAAGERDCPVELEHDDNIDDVGVIPYVELCKVHAFHELNTRRDRCHYLRMFRPLALRRLYQADIISEHQFDDYMEDAREESRG